MSFFEGLSLNEIFLYLISGYIFTTVFHFITSCAKPINFKYGITRSLLYGYILTMFYHAVPSITHNNMIDIILFFIVCAVMSYVLAQFYMSNFVRMIFRKFNIKTTIYDYIWRDIQDDKYGIWIRAVSEACNFDIFGRLVLIENYERNPMLVLDMYEYTTIDGKVEENIEEDLHRRILIDSSKCDTIRIVYNEDSDNIKNYKPFKIKSKD